MVVSLPPSSRVSGLILSMDYRLRGVYVHVLHAYLWISSGISTFLTLSKNMPEGRLAALNRPKV